MAFESLTERLNGVFKKLRGKGKLNEADIKAAMREVRMALLEADVPLVVDADGLNCLARLTSGSLPSYPEIIRRSSPLVLTPHRGELDRQAHRRGAQDRARRSRGLQGALHRHDVAGRHHQADDGRHSACRDSE